MSSEELTRTNLIVNSNSKLSPTLQCSICLDLVMDPVQCSQCTKLFCKECIDGWLKNSVQCPNKHIFKKKDVIDDWIKKTLDRIFIKCPYKKCNGSYAYSQWRNHIKICISKSQGFKPNELTPTGEEIFEWKEVQFFVKDINNKNHTFLLPLSTTVEELKKQLKTKTGFEVRQQRLSCNGKNMEDDKMLEFYGVQQNTTIIQLARLLGGN